MASAAFSTQAGAWVAHEGQTKLSFSQERYANEFILPLTGTRQTLHESYQAALVEYGVSENFTLSGKVFKSLFAADRRTTKRNEAQIGVMMNASKAATGLLPPYLFRLSKSLLPRLKLHSDKRASVLIGRFERDTRNHNNTRHLTDGNFTMLAMADKITAGRLHVMQEIESGETRLKYRMERNALYRFSVGYAAWQISSQAAQFQDEHTGFVSLSHSYRLRYKPSDGDWEITLGRGQRRVGQVLLPGTNLLRGRQWSLELQRRF